MSGVPDYAHGYFSRNFHGHLFRSILWMLVQNSKFVALPVPGIIGGTQKTWAVSGYTHAPFSPKLLMGFCSDVPCECTGQIWCPYSFIRSWDDSDWSFGCGLRTPNHGEEEVIGSRGWYRSKERWWVPVGLPYSNFSSIFTRFRDNYAYCRFCAPARHFSPPTSILPNFPMFPWEWVDGLWATKSDGVGLIVRADSFQDFQRMLSWSTNVTDRRTFDRRTGRHAIAIPRFAV